MGYYATNHERCKRFQVQVDKKDTDFGRVFVLTMKGYDTTIVNLTQEQLSQVAEAITDRLASAGKSKSKPKPKDDDYDE